MASLQQKGDNWHCQFVSQGKRHTFALGRVTRVEAEARAAQVDYLLMRLRQGLIAVPPGVRVVDFIRHDGDPPAGRDARRAGADSRPAPRPLPGHAQ